MTAERKAKPILSISEPTGTLHALLEVRKSMLRGRLFLHFGDAFLERLAGYIEGYRACLRIHGLPDPRYSHFSKWLAQSAQAPLLEESLEPYLSKADGNHEDAIRAYLELVYEFTALAPSIPFKPKRLGSGSPHHLAQSVACDIMPHILKVRQDVLQGQLHQHIGDTNVERFGAFINGLTACAWDHYLDDELYGCFHTWLRDVKHEFPGEGWTVKYLRDCQGDHQRAILKYLDFAAEFAGPYKTARFQTLIQDYKQLVARRKHESSPHRQRFQRVCAEGLKRIEARLHRLSTRLSHWRQLFGSQAPTFDLFQSLGISGKENCYSDLIAWICKLKSGAGEAFALNLLSHARPLYSQPGGFGKLLHVDREKVTDDGRIDLVLEFERLAVALEVKVWSREHETPGAQPQTESYPKALKRRLEAAGLSKEVWAVLLSPHGTQPLSADASKLSFFDLASATLSTAKSGINSDEQVIVRLFAAHLLELAAQAATGHSFWELTHALSSPRHDWPPWVILEAPAIEKLAATLEVATP